LLLFAAPAFAGPEVRYVIADVAEVRALASTAPASYVTNRLRRGAAVEVVEVLDNGWVKVRPPQGSFSYINARFLEHVVQDLPNLVVTLDEKEVDVFIGSEVVANHRPTVSGVRLKRGAQVTSIGKPIEDADGAWMPIEPPAGEVRYLPANVLSSAMPRPTPAVTLAGGPGEKPDGLRPSDAPSANVPPAPEELWARAARAEQQGQVAEAMRLYRLVWSQAARSNPNLAGQAYQRLVELQGRSAVHANAGPTARLHPPVARPAGQASSTFTVPPARPGGAAATNWRAYRGRLQRAGRTDFPDMTHRLEVDNQGTWHPLAYLRPAPGVNLAALTEGGEVEVQGEVWYQGDLKTFVMYVRKAFLVSP
jgi:hypothetical protein